MIPLLTCSPKWSDLKSEDCWAKPQMLKKLEKLTEMVGRPAEISPEAVGRPAETSPEVMEMPPELEVPNGIS